MGHLKLQIGHIHFLSSGDSVYSAHFVKIVNKDFFEHVLNTSKN